MSTKRVEPPKSKRRKNAELELEQEVAAITKHYASVKAGEQTAQADGTEAAEEKKSAAAAKKQADTSGGAKKEDAQPKRNTFFANDRFAPKKSDNPDVVSLWP